MELPPESGTRKIARLVVKAADDRYIERAARYMYEATYPYRSNTDIRLIPWDEARDSIRRQWLDRAADMFDFIFERGRHAGHSDADPRIGQ